MDDKATYLNASASARATGTTVRTLHHYEALGLIRPARGPNGYRRYGADELVRVAAIRLLQQTGLTLAAIKDLLGQSRPDLGAVMAAQERALKSEKRRVETALARTGRARAMLRRNPSLALAELIDILETTMTNKPPRAFEGLDMPELSEAQKADLAGRNFTAEDQAEVSARWSKVFADAEALAGTDPAAAPAQEMAREARALLDWFAGGDADLERKAGSMWQQAWADPERVKHMPVSAEGWAFLQQALAALKT
jgi:DNA-binding transcriptional MerR regulator